MKSQHNSELKRAESDEEIKGKEVELDSSEEAKPPQYFDEEDVADEIVERIVQRAASFSGPLPPPAMLEQYEEILPGSADRILKMAEMEQRIRETENAKILGNDWFRVFGSIIVSLALIVAGVYCAIIDQPFLGGVFGMAGVIAAIVRAFLGKRESN